MTERYQAPGRCLSQSISRAGDKDACHAGASFRRSLTSPLENHHRNLPRGLPLVFPETGRDRDALCIDAVPFLALRLPRPDLELLRTGLCPHLHPGHGIRLEVVIPPGMVRRSSLRCDDNIPISVAVVHHRGNALLSASRPHRGEEHELIPERSDSLSSLGVELQDGRCAPVRHYNPPTFLWVYI